MNELDFLYRFGIATVIGILLGLEREISKEPDQKTAAGIRTFALLGMLGAGSAYLAEVLGSIWVFAGVLFVIGIVMGIGYYAETKDRHLGLTSELAALLTFVMGALCSQGELALAVAMAVVTMGLLSLKFEMHQLVRKIQREDIFATLKFAIIAAIVLPVLPNQGYGEAPFDVLNPYRIGLMVVLISGIGFVGYISTKFVSAKKGIGLTGFMGGLVSSTAVTLSFAQRSKEGTGMAKLFGLGILLAWLVMFARVLIEVAATNTALLQTVWIPIASSGVAALVYVSYLYFGQAESSEEEVAVQNPFKLGPAIKFGLLYGVILFVARAAQMYFGDTGVYISSLLSGLADVDAITLSMAELSGPGGSVSLSTAAKAIVIAAVSNTFVKAGLVFSLGSAELKKVIWPGVVLISAVGLVVAFFM